jgi:hypothetical protein
MVPIDVQERLPERELLPEARPREHLSQAHSAREKGLATRSVFLQRIANKTLKFAWFPLGKIGVEYLDEQILNGRILVKRLAF